jgi:hypothetical protein
VLGPQTFRIDGYGKSVGLARLNVSGYGGVITVALGAILSGIVIDSVESNVGNPVIGGVGIG